MYREVETYFTNINLISNNSNSDYSRLRDYVDIPYDSPNTIDNYYEFTRNSNYMDEILERIRPRYISSRNTQYLDNDIGMPLDYFHDDPEVHLFEDDFSNN